MIQAVLGNLSHPEYGVATIPFPIRRDDYDNFINLLKALEIGDAVKSDCKIISIDSYYAELNRLQGQAVNLDELDYLAKRLDSFDDGEAAQFQANILQLSVGFALLEAFRIIPPEQFFTSDGEAEPQE